MFKRFKRPITLILSLGSILTAGLFVSLFITNPDSLGPFGITLWFVTLSTALTSFMTLGLLFIRGLGRRDETWLISLRQGALVSVWFTAVLALYSLHQLVIRDILLITILVVLIEFYFRKA